MHNFKTYLRLLHWGRVLDLELLDQKSMDILKILVIIAKTLS